jgi:hypothetical protein
VAEQLIAAVEAASSQKKTMKYNEYSIMNKLKSIAIFVL